MPESPFVRPSKAVLDKLAIAVPDLGVDLSKLDHPLVVKAQTVPGKVAAGGSVRIQSLNDQPWYQAKVNDLRGIVGSFECPHPGMDLPVSWWLSDAGHRKQDSRQDDFYDNLPEDPTTRTPVQWDWMRWDAERAVEAQQAVKRAIRTVGRASMRSGQTESLLFTERSEVRVRIRIKDHEDAYLAISMCGVTDKETFALILSSFKEVPSDDWLPEPQGAVGIKPEPGEIIFSTLLSVAAQHSLLSED
ncbi:hypothetical protein GCM10009636_08450 [Arthrobacter koreensis]|uniref:hypothetical protein n=1 Tax=Arthrobacter koreensis TaxID=199136 RepID=UPI001264257E|nr:hypothetical protein [Arthrobacter koreensis]